MTEFLIFTAGVLVGALAAGIVIVSIAKRIKLYW